MNRPKTTLFLLMSVDGKISTGATDDLDFDKDIPVIPYACDGLHQYYELEAQTDEWSLCTGKTQAKIGVNTRPLPDKTNVNFVIIDNYHLTESGVTWLATKAKKLVIATSNPEHPAYRTIQPNVTVIKFTTRVDLPKLLEALYTGHGCKALTIQSGGSLNKAFMDEGLIDMLDIVVAPIIVGGAHTPTLIDGADNTDLSRIMNHGNLKLIHCAPLNHHYVRLIYKVRRGQA